MLAIRCGHYLQFIRACESFGTEHPSTGERSVARVPPEMCSQVRCFAISFVTAGNVAYMLPLLEDSITATGGFSSVVTSLATVGARARHAVGKRGLLASCNTQRRGVILSK